MQTFSVKSLVKIEKALKDTVIAKQFGLTLKSFFKDYFKYWDDCYLIPFIDIQLFKKQYYDFIKSSCNDEIVCSNQQSCYGHQFLQFVELIIQFQRYCLLKKKVYFKYFLFSNFKITCDKVTKIKSWQVTGVSVHQLNHLTYSERLSLLVCKNEKMYKLFKTRKSGFS